MSDPKIRSLVHLEDTASTARVLNLPAIWKKHQIEDEYNEKPFFNNPQLNKCFIIKHRLRRNETDLFPGGRTSATKILVPMDHTNLKIGGRYAFVGQRGYSVLLDELLGDKNDTNEKDRRLLEILDNTPSLDPFLLREQLKRYGIAPARCYFDISDADMKRMFDFVQAEIEPLVATAFGGDVAFTSQTAKLASKILSSDWDGELNPLRETLKLAENEYQEGVFCWKGFLYYKWTLRQTLPGAKWVSDQLSVIKPTGHIDKEWAEYLERTKYSIRRAITENCEAIRKTIKVYDDAYANLTFNGKPMAFREFLLDAPKLFASLGERLSTLNHIHHFWKFRFPLRLPTPVTVEDFIAILVDLEISLNCESPEQKKPDKDAYERLKAPLPQAAMGGY